MKRLLSAFLILVLAGCTGQMERAATFNEQLAYVDAGLKGAVESALAQYDAGTLTQDEAHSIADAAQAVEDALKQATALHTIAESAACISPQDQTTADKCKQAGAGALAALQTAQSVLIELQKQVEAAKGASVPKAAIPQGKLTGEALRRPPGFARFTPTQKPSTDRGVSL